MHVSVRVCTPMYERMEVRERNQSGVFFHPSLSCCLETRILPAPDLNILARLVEQQALRIDWSPHSRLFIWVLGIQTQVLMRATQVLLPTGHLPFPGQWHNSLRVSLMVCHSCKPLYSLRTKSIYSLDISNHMVVSENTQQVYPGPG